MWEKFIHLLADPVDGSKLKLKNDILISESGHQYNLKDDIPVLLNTPHQNKDFSGQLCKDFQYHDHYQKDAEYFDYSKSYEESVTNFEQEMLHKTILFQIPKNAKIILDVGCGNGWVAKNLLPKNHVVISMDISSVNPVKAVQKYIYPNHLGLIADSLALPFRANTLDAVIGAEIMEHVVDPALFIQQLYPALKPGGKFILTTHYNEKLE
jgi:2-polyprenyl-3-methyl-5-hydroxy-6-metoxy-1,4-benzoquinol methylase